MVLSLRAQLQRIYACFGGTANQIFAPSALQKYVVSRTALSAPFERGDTLMRPARGPEPDGSALDDLGYESKKIKRIASLWRSIGFIPPS